MTDEKKIIIDQDWKKEAKAEKEKLSKENKESQESSDQQSQQLPDADFSVLVSMLSTQALFAMGLVAPEGMEDKIKKDLKLAQFNIDLLAIIEEKTKGNLSKEEEELLSGSLSQLRMAYVTVAEK
ncbi:hypothetical protein SMSP2_00758 [Limihaloglobus sulfuriphilus]|uniref:DUF1844 domain-containing protein n=1 Tax=Limihaloglobus sulfuriphilus TaxID=1851148 RepID=A0A1Q2MCL1_9BACT|nr:DUF1844 domain-containing protein [Limihaloglobus sulfuriphilus]AQQ70410.1 hypothetical protein SMSP2_00758 [Limihaloglobus sulfuriphilus]